MKELPPQNFEVAKGEDWPIEIRVFGEKSVKLAGDAVAGATSLFLHWDHPAMSDGDKLLFGDHVVVTLDEDLAAGATTADVVALAGPLRSGLEGHELRDLTGYDIEMEILEAAGDETPLVSKTDADVTLADQTGDDRGKVLIDGEADDIASLVARSYPWFAWRRGDGVNKRLCGGILTVTDAGFQ